MSDTPRRRTKSGRPKLRLLGRQQPDPSDVVQLHVSDRAWYPHLLRLMQEILEGQRKNRKEMRQLNSQTARELKALRREVCSLMKCLKKLNAAGPPKSRLRGQLAQM